MTSKASPSSNLTRTEIFLVAVLLAAVIVRTWILPGFASLWIDEWAVYLIGSEGPARIDALQRQYIADQRMISLMGWAGMQMVGVNEFGLRLYSLLFGGYCLFAIYQLGRRWFDARTALLSMLLFPCLHAVYQQTANARAYIPALAFFLSLLWCVELWLERRRWFWLLIGAICGYLLVVTHLLQAVGLGLVALRVLWTVRPWKQWLWPLAILLPGFAEAVRQVISKPLTALNYLPMPAPTDFLQALFPQPAAGLLLLVLAAVLGLRLAAWSRPDDTGRSPSMVYYVLAAWLLPPLLIYGLSVASKASTFLPRYYFTAFPAAAWLLGWILARVEPFRWRAASIVLIAAGSIVILAGRHPFPSTNHENWRDALATIRQMRSSPAEPVLLYSGFVESDFPDWRDFYKPGGMCRAGLDFYHFDGNIIGLPYTDRADRIAELRPELDATLASNKRVWLLSRSQHGPIMNWLDSYLAIKGWKARRMGFFDSVRLDTLEPDPAVVNKLSGQ